MYNKVSIGDVQLLPHPIADSSDWNKTLQLKLCGFKRERKRCLYVIVTIAMQLFYISNKY